jgi:hypothetical protein
MKKPPDNPEFARFTKAMGMIMGVSKTAAMTRDEAEKRERPVTRMPAGPKRKG